MSKPITKTDLVELISKTTTEVFEANERLLENQLIETVETSVKIASYVTIKVLNELDILKLE